MLNFIQYGMFNVHRIQIGFFGPLVYLFRSSALSFQESTEKLIFFIQRIWEQLPDLKAFDLIILFVHQEKNKIKV